MKTKLSATWIVIASILMQIAITACTVSDNTIGTTMRDGVWEGTGEGRGGTILVRISVTNNTITDAKVISQSESSFAQAALNEVLDNAIGRTDYLSLDTDGVTGATLTSTGVIDALNMAIATSKGEKTEEEKIYADGYCDIVVIGAGGAGLCAAVEAASKGYNVTVIEKQGIVGGNTNYSTG